MMKQRRTLSLLATNFLLCAAVCAVMVGCDRDKQTAKVDEPQESAAADESVRSMGKVKADDRVTAVLLLRGDEGAFAAIDADQDKILSFQEFGTAAEMVNLFGAFEAAGQAIDAASFANTMFQYWDSDDDGFVEPSEYLSNAQKWLPDSKMKLTNFAEVDADKNGLLSEAEFAANLSKIGLFEAWDRDSDTKLSSAELVKVVHEIWDVDSDKRITVAEFGGPEVSNGTTAGVASITVTILNPVDYIGTAISGDAKVADVVGPRGFWLASNGAKVFAVVQKGAPDASPPSIEKGQRIGFNGVLVSTEAAKELAGDLDPAAQKILEDEPAFLSLYPSQLVVLGKEGG